MTARNNEPTENEIQKWDAVTKGMEHWGIPQVFIQPMLTGCWAALPAPGDPLRRVAPADPLGGDNQTIRVQVFPFSAPVFSAGKQKTENDTLKGCHQKN